jgi:tRNA1Val (adenine37-N6)-methyltransferase
MNLAANGWQERGRSLPADVTDTSALEQGLADLVVCNPPYVAPGRGRSRRVAAGARVGELASFTAAARRVVGPRPAQALATLFTELRNAGLEPKRLRFVHATRDESARVALVMALPAKKGGLFVTPPIVERDAGRLSAELEAILEAPPGAVQGAE